MPRQRTYRYQTTDGPSNSLKGPTGEIDYDAVLKNVDGLVKHLMSKYRVSGKDPAKLDDLYQDCRLAICRAAETWDPSKSAWGTWAYKAISHTICNEFTRRSLDRNKPLLSLNTIFEPTNMCHIGKCRMLETVENNEFIEWCIQQVDPVDGVIIRRYYYGGETYRGIGKTLGLSGERIRQRIVGSIERIRKALKRPDGTRGSMALHAGFIENELVSESATPGPTMERKVFDYKDLARDGDDYLCPVCKAKFYAVKGVMMHMRHRHGIVGKVINLPKRPKKSRAKKVAIPVDDVVTKADNKALALYRQNLNMLTTTGHYFDAHFIEGIKHAITLFDNLHLGR